MNLRPLAAEATYAVEAAQSAIDAAEWDEARRCLHAALGLVAALEWRYPAGVEAVDPFDGEGPASGVPVDGEASEASPPAGPASPDGDVVATPDATPICERCGYWWDAKHLMLRPTTGDNDPCVHCLCGPLPAKTSHPTHLSVVGPTPPTHGAGGGRGALDARHLHPSNHKPGA